jgi:NAD(P)H-dependent FMN reductase|tara:strand:- start:471 stop:986 length:516 start_codon:yes stop_codon:yes gene_type:complete
MNTLILSSSLSEKSRSYLLCKEVEKILISKGNNIIFIDAKEIPMQPFHRIKSNEMNILGEQIEKADNIIIGMGVHCYSVNDSLKILLEGCFGKATGKFFGILCAAGGERSYLVTQHLTQICMNEWRMIQLPRIVYATGKDFTESSIKSKELLERIEIFSKEFHTIGNKLLT